MTSQVGQAEDTPGRTCRGLPRVCGAVVPPGKGASPKQTGTFLRTSLSLQSASGTATVGPGPCSRPPLPAAAPGSGLCPRVLQKSLFSQGARGPG